MVRTCLAIIDATRARFFVHELSVDPEGTTDAISERVDLVDPARRRTEHELFSDGRPGSSRNGSHHFGFDDHRDAHLDNMDAVFARAAIGEIQELLRTTGSRRLILCASPRMLGALRAEGSGPWRVGLVIDEVPRDLVKLTIPELRDMLASYGLLPPLDRAAHRANAVR